MSGVAINYVGAPDDRINSVVVNQCPDAPGQRHVPGTWTRRSITAHLLKDFSIICRHCLLFFIGGQLTGSIGVPYFGVNYVKLVGIMDDSVIIFKNINIGTTMVQCYFSMMYRWCQILNCE